MKTTYCMYMDCDLTCSCKSCPAYKRVERVSPNQNKQWWKKQHHIPRNDNNIKLN